MERMRRFTWSRVRASKRTWASAPRWSEIGKHVRSQIVQRARMLADVPDHLPPLFVVKAIVQDIQIATDERKDC